MKIFNAPRRADWGNRSQIGGTIQDLKDVLGNQDGIWGNEHKAQGTTGDFFDKNPMAAKIAEHLSVGFSARDEVSTLKAFTAAAEKAWGEPVLSVDKDRLNGGDLFAAQKAIALTRLGRTPSEVTDHFVTAGGSVNGRDVPDRDIFTQRFKPTGEPSGKVLVLSPGFQETGRNFYEQIDKLNQLGHEVVVMDHQWAGQTDGKKGGLDSGFGVARDVAAVAAYAQTLVDNEPGLDEVILYGNSMGAGPGVIGAMTLNDNGLIDLDGPQMPQGLRAVVQAPFLEGSPNLVNDVVGFASKIPMLNAIKAPAAGVPVLTTDNVGAQKGAQHAVLEDVRAQLSAMTAAEDDIQFMLGLIERGQGPGGQLAVVHGDDDPLAHAAKCGWLKDQLGDQMTYRQIDSGNHVLQENPGEQHHAIDLLQQMLASDG